MVTKRCTALGPCRRAYPAPMDVLLPVVLLVAGLAVGFAVGRRASRAVPSVESAPIEPTFDVAAVADGLPLPALVLDAGQRVLHANPLATLELPEFARGVDVGSVSSSLAAALSSGESREPVIIGDPPRTFRVSLVRTPERALGILVDATEEVDFEEARRTFSSAVSHELRTPLARILGLAESLALPDLEDERMELVTQIENEVDGIRTLIDEMLLLAALDRGRLAVADGVVDASATVVKVVDEARQRRIGRGRVIEVEVEAGIDVPVAARLFEVVVQNLVDNALIHGGPDALVDVALRRGDGGASLVVADSGAGIPAQHLPFVFQRFYRGDASRTGSGTGLGLALVKHIVEAHGGTVVADSDGESGATFRVELPVAD